MTEGSSKKMTDTKRSLSPVKIAVLVTVAVLVIAAVIAIVATSRARAAEAQCQYEMAFKGYPPEVAARLCD